MNSLLRALLQSSNLPRVLISLGLLTVLIGVNLSIYSKERIKHTGVTVFLELAPVDPRSLMQGDYMALRFKLEDEIFARRDAFEHFDRAPIELDARRVATLSLAPAPNPLRIRYRIQNGGVWLGTNAYFFEEGTAARYADARYGEFKLEEHSGEAVLVGLRDAELRPL